MSRSMRFSNEPPRLQFQPFKSFRETYEMDSSQESTCCFAQIDDVDGLSFGEGLLKENDLEKVQQKVQPERIARVDILDFSFGQKQQEPNQIKCVPHDRQKILEGLQPEKTKERTNLEKDILLKVNQNLSLSDDIESVEAEDMINYLTNQEKSANIERLLNKFQTILESKDLSMAHSQIVQQLPSNLFKSSAIESGVKSIKINKQKFVNERKKLIETVRTVKKKYGNKLSVSANTDSNITFIDSKDSIASHQMSASTNLSYEVIKQVHEYYKKLNVIMTQTINEYGRPRERRCPGKYWEGEKVELKKDGITRTLKMKQIEDYFRQEQQMSLCYYKTILTGASYIKGIITIRLNESITLTLGGFSITIISKGSSRVQEAEQEVRLKIQRRWRKQISLHKRQEVRLKNDSGADCSVTIIINA